MTTPLEPLAYPEESWEAALLGQSAAADEQRDVLRKLNDLEMSLERAFFSLQRLKAEVERAAGQPGPWPLSGAFLAYVCEQSPSVSGGLWELNGALRDAFVPGGSQAPARAGAEPVDGLV